MAAENEGRAGLAEEVLLAGWVVGLLGDALLVDAPVASRHDTCRPVLLCERDERHDRSRSTGGEIWLQKWSVVGVKLLTTCAWYGASVGDLSHGPSVGQELIDNRGQGMSDCARLGQTLVKSRQTPSRPVGLVATANLSEVVR